jgi:hypothetical protein
VESLEASHARRSWRPDGSELDRLDVKLVGAIGLVPVPVLDHELAPAGRCTLPYGRLEGGHLSRAHADEPLEGAAVEAMRPLMGHATAESLTLSERSIRG